MSVTFSSNAPRSAGLSLPSVNWCNANAARLLEVLGLPSVPYGFATLPVARRAVMRARSRRDLAPFTRAEESSEGFVSFGLDSDGIAARVEAFARFVEDAAALGATEINWG